MSRQLNEVGAPTTLDATATLTALDDGDLLRRLLGASATGATFTTLAAELDRRLGHENHRSTLRRLLQQYATAAPEYVDEDLQATARIYLGRYFRAT